MDLALGNKRLAPEVSILNLVSFRLQTMVRRIAF